MIPLLAQPWGAGNNLPTSHTLFVFGEIELSTKNANASK